MGWFEDFYNKGVDATVQRLSKEIEKVNSTEVPQHVLWTKTVSHKLEEGRAHCETIGDKFYFTETLVNKLMYLAYLAGASDIDEKSRQLGWDQARKDMVKRLELTSDELEIPDEY